MERTEVSKVRRKKGQRMDRKSIKCQEGSKVEQTSAEPRISRSLFTKNMQNGLVCSLPPGCLIGGAEKNPPAGVF